jgi:hypothetical protein
MTRAEIIKWLDSYIDVKKERDGILALIAELEEDRAGSQLRSPQLDGMPHSGRISDPTATSAARFAALLERYEEKAAALYDRMREIEDAIGDVENSAQRDMLRAHYLRGLSWDDVAKAKAYSVSRCTHIAGEGITAILERQQTIA